MIIAFETEKLRYICEDGAMATKELGMPASQALQQQLADLRAADSIDELLVGRPRTTGPDNEYLTIDVTPSIETVWVANHVNARRDSQGRIDWKATKRLRLREIKVRAA